MSPEQIKSLIELGEGSQVEFKVSIPSKVRELSEEVCAMANAAGGVVIIGVDDHNNIRGVVVDNAKRSAIQNSISEISPKLSCNIETVKVEGKNLVVINVLSGKDKPYIFSGSIYLRIGPNSQKLTSSEEMREFFQQSNKIFFDQMPCPKFNTTADFDNKMFKLFRNEAKLSGTVSDK